MPELAEVLDKHRAQGKRIVLCHGVFDLLHIGHIRYLRQARAQGDVLVVTLTPDRFVDKGPHRPAFTEQLRAEALASLDSVDYVCINLWPTAEETVRLLRPHIYAKGAEFRGLEDATGKIALEAKVCEETGTELVFVEDIVFSSSSLINKYLAAFSDECQEYLNIFRKRHPLESIHAAMDSFEDLTVLVVGDVILDEYIYCSALGASSKDPVLALLHKNNDIFVGGAAAVANHLAQHVRKVVFCTVIGDDGYKDFIASSLAPNVELHSVVRPQAPTVRKVRILDHYSFQKQLEIYHMETAAMAQELDEAYSSLVCSVMPEADMVVSADFGHGCISEKLVDALCSKAPFLAVNTQANAGNRGYHTIDRYSRADFVSLATPELRLQFRNCTLSNLDMLAALRETMGLRYALVTEGRQGCSLLTNEDFYRAPSFVANVVDRVGAGDALFSVTALAACKGLPGELIVFLGNIAGALAVETLGNAKAVSREAMKRFIVSVMK